MPNGKTTRTASAALAAGTSVRLGKSRIRAHEASLLAYAQAKLGEINSLRIIGTAAEKGAIVSFEMKSAHAHDFATVLDRSGIAVRAGTHCAMPLLERFGVTATCRASFALYNTTDEVDVLVRAIAKAMSRTAPSGSFEHRTRVIRQAQQDRGQVLSAA